MILERLGRRLIQKKFLCDYCKRKFKMKHHLQNHKETCKKTIDEKPFSYEVCEKTFKLKHHLKNHSKICKHGNNILKNCDKCNMILKTTYDIKVHKKNCINKFNCEYCEYTGHVNNYSQHFNAKHRRETPALSVKPKVTKPKKVYECVVCKNYYDKATLNRHKTNVHKQNSINHKTKDHVDDKQIKLVSFATKVKIEKKNHDKSNYTCWIV